MATPKRMKPAERSNKARIDTVPRGSASRGSSCRRSTVTRERLAEAEEPVRAAAGGDREAVLLKRVVHFSEPGTGANRCHASRDRHRAHGRYVDEEPFRRGAPGEAVAPAPDRRVQPGSPRERDRFGDVFGGSAQHDSSRSGAWNRAMAGLRTDS
jgi:hypothetical protein